MINISAEELRNVVTRLENACKLLESKSGQTTIQSSMLTTEKIATFADFWNRTLRCIVDLKAAAKEANIPELESLSEIAAEAVCAHQDILLATETFQKPDQSNLGVLSKRIIAFSTRASEIGKTKRDFANHSEAIKNGLDTLFWIFQESGCDAVAQTYYESIDFPANRIYKEKKPEQTKWVKAYKAVIKEINDLVAKNYKNGINWNAKGDKDFDKLFVSLGNTYRENFKKGEKAAEATEAPDSRGKLLQDITQGVKLKPVQKEEAKDELKASSVLAKKEAPMSSKDKRGLRMSIHKKGKTDKYEEGRQSFFLQNFEDETKTFDESVLQNRTSILISNSIGSTFHVPKKINKLGLSNCENVKVVLDSLISIFEITNSKKIEIYVKGTVNSFSIDQTDGVAVHLSNDSRNAQFYTSKSSEVLIRLPKEDDPDDFTEMVIPEQFVFTINKDRKLEAKISDLYGY